MMLAFLVDQALQQCCCAFLNAVWTKVESKRQLWEDIRSMFRFFNVDSMESLYQAILSDIKVQLPDLTTR